jgi:hypothetical protein
LKFTKRLFKILPQLSAVPFSTGIRYLSNLAIARCWRTKLHGKKASKRFTGSEGLTMVPPGIQGPEEVTSWALPKESPTHVAGGWEYGETFLAREVILWGGVG